MPRTHMAADRELCGEPIEIQTGRATVRLVTDQRMGVDAMGMVHGGFLFGAADYAAMLAVNEPNVVIGKASCRFIRPVRVGDTVEAEARCARSDGRRHVVVVEVRHGETLVLDGEFVCYVPDRHVLEGSPA